METRPSMAGPQVIPAFVINLKRAAARQVIMRETCSAAGVQVHFVDAVDSQTDEGRAAVDRLPDFGPWGVFHGHDRACTLSHYKALVAFLETPATHGLILEDDVFLASDLGEWMEDALWWPANADVVKFERWRDDKLLVALEKRTTSVGDRMLRVLQSRHSGGAGYAVTRAAAERILAVAKPDVPIDHLLFNPNVSRLARGLTTYQVMPAMIVQGNEPPPEPAAPRQDRGQLPESKLRKDLLRGWQEIKVIPRLLALLLTRRISLEKVHWADGGRAR
ncbi:glycosyltransferase family 25 protein [Jannaschia sp. CCS1]|uniref:glycosyltransferase family 25 protein n=1 Tax=Jannaschia sp. (strain CCS1) TaxID=290400 RepID=UPI00006BFFA3|nr:glycosyltransferase family 25 protein [Jannaschia sp. CCS1]ABD53741.1 glycosyl transferase family 25 [Jannaschia sp. CCS1]